MRRFDGFDRPAAAQRWVCGLQSALRLALLAGLLPGALTGCKPAPPGAAGASGAANPAMAGASGSAGPSGVSGVSGAPAPGAAASAPPVTVSLVRAALRDFTLTLDASGTVATLSSVDIKPQVSAQVQTVHVKEGQFVQRGQPLFTLDARIDAANLKKAEAQMLKDQATLADARRQLLRNQDLLAKNFISQGAVDTSLANVDAQAAVVAADRAAIDAVKAQLSFSTINAPGAGRVGAIAVFAGSSVSPTGAALLTITQIDPVAVVFSLPQRNLPDALAALASGNGRVTAVLPESLGAVAAGPARAANPAANTANTAAIPAPGMAASAAMRGPAPGGPASADSLGAPGRPRGSQAAAGARQGKLIFVDSAVDAASGTIKVKAQFSNKDQALWPGAYVNVKMALQTLPEAIVIPQAAIVQGARGTVVFAAGPGNVAVVRPVKVLASAGTDAVVSGLRPGERVVLDGRQNVRPGVLLIERAGEGGRGASGPRGGGGGGGGAADPPASAPGGPGGQPNAPVSDAPAANPAGPASHGGPAP